MATCLPIFAPCSSALRKWIPDQTRASTTSSIACEKRVKLRVRPPLFVSVHPIRSLRKKSCNVATKAELSPLCPDECSGYGGVGTSGSQFGSAFVHGLPSVSASRIAVIGRQNGSCALSFQTVISASAPDMYSIANRRALSASDSPCCADNVRKVRLQVAGGFSAQ